MQGHNSAETFSGAQETFQETQEHTPNEPPSTQTDYPM